MSTPSARQQALLDHLAEIDAAYAVAEKAGHALGMLRATETRARMLGLLDGEAPLEPIPVTDAEQRKQLKTAQDLIADAAASLDLPRSATPAQIVGALAERRWPTPQAYRVMPIHGDARTAEATPPADVATAAPEAIDA